MMKFRKNYALLGAAFTLGTLVPQSANAVTTVAATQGEDQGFSQVFERVVVSFGGLPGLLSMAAYLMGVVFAIGGILKIKDHVENPGQTELKAGAIRLVIGGALFALPFIMSLMTGTIGDQTQDTTVVNLKRATFGYAP
jgi:hypothetical protein